MKIMITKKDEIDEPMEANSHGADTWKEYCEGEVNRINRHVKACAEYVEKDGQCWVVRERGEMQSSMARNLKYKEVNGIAIPQEPQSV